MSTTETNFPLPSARYLWEANEEKEWRRRSLAVLHPTAKAAPTLSDAMKDLLLMGSHGPIIDVDLAGHAVLYGLWIRIWPYLDSQSFYGPNRYSMSYESTACLEMRHHELCGLVKTIRETLLRFRVLSPEARMISDFFLMSLHLSYEDVQKLAGRFGDEEAKASSIAFKHWVNSKDRYYTTWYAGQVLRAASEMPLMHLDGFHAILMFQASLTLWVSATLVARYPTWPRDSHNIFETEQESDVFGMNSSTTNCWPTVILNGKENIDTEAYLMTGSGILAVELSGRVGLLSDHSVLPLLMSTLFAKHYPVSFGKPPLIVESLINLIADLTQVVNPT